jgi:hypothetical protein
MPAILAVLVVLLLGLAAWKLWVQLDLVDQRAAQVGRDATDFFVKQARSKVWTGAIGLVLISLAIAGGVGAACYFLSGRRPAAAQIGMAAPLALVVASLTYQAFTFATGAPPVSVAQTPAAPTPAPPSPPTAPLPAAPPGRPAPPPAPSPAPSQVLSPVPSRPQSPSTSPAPAKAPEPPAEPEAPARPASGSVEDVQAWLRLRNSAAAAALVPLTDALSKDLSTLAERGDEAIKSLAMKGRPSNKALDQRRDLAREGKVAAMAAETRLSSLHEEAEALLKAAGISEASFIAHDASFHLASGGRRIAPGQYREFFDALLTHSTLLRENGSKWTVAKDGTIEARDTKLRMDLHTPAFQIEVFQSRQADLRRQLLSGE